MQSFSKENIHEQEQQEEEPEGTQREPCLRRRRSGSRPPEHASARRQTQHHQGQSAQVRIGRPLRVAYIFLTTLLLYCIIKISYFTETGACANV